MDGARVRMLAGWRGALLAGALAAAACGAPEAVVDCRGAGPLEPVCGFRNPEDLVVLPGGEWLVVSQFPPDAQTYAGGSLVAFRPADGARRVLFPPRGRGVVAPPDRDVLAADCPGPPDSAHFGPHGIDLADGGRTLLVVNHGGREAVERFAVVQGAPGPWLLWRGCAPLPEGDFANDVAALPGGAFAVTRMLSRDRGAGDVVRLALGLDTGFVLLFEPGSGWRRLEGSDASAPNGIAASRDGAQLFVGEWGARRLLRLARDGSAREEVELPHRPDNLSWAPDQRLLVTGQDASLLEIPRCAELAQGTCGLPFSVVAVDPQSLATETLFVHDPARVSGAASVAVARDMELWVGTFAGDRLLRVRRP